MANFANVEPALAPILDELCSREPIFHRVAFGRCAAEFDRAMAPG